MTNKFDKPDHKPALPVQMSKLAKPYDLSGGRCRARTYDPLIKSQPIRADFIAENFKPNTRPPITHQCVNAEIQTAPVIKNETLTPEIIGSGALRAPSFAASGCVKELR